MIDKAKPSPLHSRADFVSDQEVRWCPGCGDYAILATMQRTLAKFDIPRERHVFISGIGCSSRFPYYMNTYGFHSIHGRAPTIASGLKCANRDLIVWVITGDGDGLSIGGNHLLHCLRRNMDLKIILVNNAIYGLTKGQYSPTSKVGKVTASSPMGSLDHPINPLCIAIASEATFVARTLDSDPKHMGMVLERALAHKGAAFIEIYQNCVVFNKDVHTPVTGRDTRGERLVYLEHGQPLVFGAERDKAIVLDGLKPVVVQTNAVPADRLLGHDEKDEDPTYAYLLTQMEYPELPVPFGIFRAIKKPTYDEQLEAQIQESIDKQGEGRLEDLLYGGETWTVPPEPEAPPRRVVRPRRIARLPGEMPNCPSCGAENLPGVDHCEECLMSLIQSDLAPARAGDPRQRILTLPVSEILPEDDRLLIADPDDSLRKVIRIMREKGRAALLVTQANKLVGILSRRDIFMQATKEGLDLSQVTVASIMTPNPEVVKADAPIAWAVNKMAAGGFRQVPVVDDAGRPLGLITIDLVMGALSR